MIFPYENGLALQALDGSMTYYSLKLTPAAHTLTVSTFPRSKQKSYPLSYRETGPGRLEIEGTFNGRKVHARLHREEDSKYLLISRGFHWINEYPLNE